MKTVRFLKWILNPIESEYVGLDDIINVNGVVGWLDFVGHDIIAVIDEKEVLHKIAKKDIRSIVKYSNFIEDNLCSVAIKELIVA